MPDQPSPLLPPDVVVTGERLDLLRHALDECVARHCPPRDDVSYSLAYARAQFVAGDYDASRRTLEAARGRNKRFAKTFPIQVSWIQHGLGTMANLTGLRDLEQYAMIGMVRALKSGLAEDDPHILMARIEVAGAFIDQHELDTALLIYREVAHRARSNGMPGIEALALFRRAAVLTAIARVYTPDRSRVEDAIKEVQRLKGAETLPFRNATLLLDAVLITNKAARAAAIDAGIAKMEPARLETPILLYTPRLDFSGLFGVAAGEAKTPWVDIDYLVDTRGRPVGIQTLRQSPNMRSDVTKALIAAVAQRRFMPMVGSSAVAGPHRLERYSFVSDLLFNTGSLIPKRASIPRLVVTDLTDLPRETRVGAGDAGPPL